jgi:hypothetical protein
MGKKVKGHTLFLKKKINTEQVLVAPYKIKTKTFGHKEKGRHNLFSSNLSFFLDAHHPITCYCCYLTFLDHVPPVRLTLI